MVPRAAAVATAFGWMRASGGRYLPRPRRPRCALNETAYVTLPVAGRAPTHTGKVRDLFDFGDSLLLVASDRISAFDVVLGEPIPGKGVVLTALTDFWLDLTAPIVRSHRITSRVDDMPGLAAADRERLRGRAMLCRKAKPYPFEFVVRGYLSGSGWNDYRKTGSISGVKLPAGLRESERLPEPILTPTTKEAKGHDLPVSFDVVAQSLGAAKAAAARDAALGIFAAGSRHALERGVILADTKFELGEVDGRLTLIDEVLTPDSSRFWPADGYEPGRAQPSYDKQIVRDWLLSTGWSKTPPAPKLPPEVIARTTAKYEEICKRLTGRTPQEFAAAGERRAGAGA